MYENTAVARRPWARWGSAAGLSVSEKTSVIPTSTIDINKPPSASGLGNETALPFPEISWLQAEDFCLQSQPLTD